MKILSPKERQQLTEELTRRFTIMPVQWVQICESPLYPEIIYAAHMTAWGRAKALISEVYSGDDK